jgi:ParB family chromosome partitioning protein
MGKSRQYVTLSTALIDPPDWLMSAYREGRCRGLAELYELRKLANDHPQFVEAWASDRSVITRERVAALRADLAEGSGSVRRGTSALIESIQSSLEEGGAQEKVGKTPAVNVPSAAPAPRTQRQAPLRLLASLGDAEVVVNTLQAPLQAGLVFVSPVDGGPAQAVHVGQLTLIGLVSGPSCQTV